MATGRIAQVVLQPTSQCNLNCSYCYVPNRRDPTRMTRTTLESAVRAVLQCSLVQGEVEFLWHAGEPLMAGLAHFEDAVELIDLYRPDGFVVHKSIQTNGTLLDRKWCRFLAEYGFGVGLSVDGPAFLHDMSRRNWSGRSSHKQVMDGYRTLIDNGIRPGAICVLTRQSLQFPDEIFAFFADNGFVSVGFNVEEVENDHHLSSLKHSAQAVEVVDEYRRFMDRIFDLWAGASDRIVIREFRDLISIIGTKLVDPSYSRQPLETIPLAIITIQKDGRVSTFSPEFAGGRSAQFADFVIGNVNGLHRLEDVLASSVLKAMSDQVYAGRQACAKQCQYFDLCGGAYTSNRLFENGSLTTTETTACRLHRQTLASVVLEKLAYDTS